MNYTRLIIGALAITIALCLVGYSMVKYTNKKEAQGAFSKMKEKVSQDTME